MIIDLPGAKTPKHCFVTIGATAEFNPLIRATLSQPFLHALQSAGYTNLRIQYGRGGKEIFRSLVEANEAESAGQCGLEIDGFDFKEDIVSDMKLAQARDGRMEGLVICHAGSGSILAAMRIDVPIVVVPNASLLDNHQVELAEELARQGFVVHGRLDDLPSSIRESKILREKQAAWPPKKTQNDPPEKGLVGIMDEEMGFYD